MKAEKAAAILTVKDAPNMTPKGRRQVAAWLRRQAMFIEKEGKSLSSRFTARYLYLLLLVTLICSALPAKAQNTYEFGALFDPSTTPKFKGVASFLTPLDLSGNTLSYSSALVNKPVDGVFTYGIVTGLRRKLPIPAVYGISFWGDAQGGAAVSPSATSGALVGGLVATRPVKGKIVGFVSAKTFVIPVSEGLAFQVIAGFQIAP